MPHDPKCWDLAESFLSDARKEGVPVEKHHFDELAQLIQDTIEDFIDWDLKRNQLRDEGRLTPMKIQRYPHSLCQKCGEPVCDGNAHAPGCAWFWPKIRAKAKRVRHEKNCEGRSEISRELVRL